MIYFIKSSILTAKINSFGAELISVKNNVSQNEFIWTGDPKYWSSHAPNLFPFVGRLEGQKYTYNGKEYEMTKHGLAKYNEFELVDQKENYLDLKFVANEKTLKLYPFNFEFHVIYFIDDEKLNIKFFVKNNDSKEMIFSYGYHPGFNVPINNKGSFNDYYLEFSKDNYLNRKFDRGLDIFKDEKVVFEGNVLNFNDHTFDEDLFYKDCSDVITLRCKHSNDFVKVEFSNMTSLGLWKANGTDAPYVCIEPWHGFPGPANKICELESQIETIKLKTEQEYNNFIVITFHVE